MNKVLKVVNDQNIAFNVKIKEEEEELGKVVEFYDARYVEGFTEYGQFVASYYVDTIMEHNYLLLLDANINDWQVSHENIKAIQNWLKK